MPIQKEKYPTDWATISHQVRTDAGWCCEWCGAQHQTVIQRRAIQRELSGNQAKDWVRFDKVTNANGQIEPTSTMTFARLRFFSLTRIVITTAHLDRDQANNDRENLAALCQRCHLRHDVIQHITNRRYGRDHARPEQLKIV